MPEGNIKISRAFRGHGDLRSISRFELVRLVTEGDAFFLSTAPAIDVAPTGTQ